MEFDFEQQPGWTAWNRDFVKTDTPLISIITPFYNDMRFIQQTCDCVLNQTFPYFEWIVVNDGSTEAGVSEYLQKIAQKDPRIRVLEKENGGPSAARNFGVLHAKTDLILPLDADDLLEPTFLEYCWWMLQKNPGATWAYTDSLGFGSENYLWCRPFDPMQLKTENQLTITALIRKSDFLAMGGYSEERKKFNEDWQLWLKLVADGHYPAQATGECLFWYRRSNDGVLSDVLTRKENASANKRIIAEAAKHVVNPEPPVIFPKQSIGWDGPKMSDWSKCVYANKDKKHILFLFPHLVMGGADKFNFDLIQGLDKSKYDTSIMTTLPSSNDWLQRFRSITPNIFNLANFMELKDYAEFISYYIKSRQVDVLFVSNSFHGYYLIPWLRENFPDLAIVDYVHMEEWYWRNGGFARTSAAIGSILEKTYVCNSATEDVLVQHFNREPKSVETVHIGVDADYFNRKAVQAGTLYQELNLASTRPIVLFICRLHPQKRPFMMLEIAKRVSQRVPGVAFAVVGNGPQEAELREKADAMGLSKNVYFMGARKEVRPYYRDAKVTLVCSLKEGLSLTAYESCAMGVPVVSADVGGQRDLVDNRVGALIPCQQTEADSLDARAFAEAEVKECVQEIVDLLTNSKRWEDAAETCRQRIENGFTIQNMVSRFESELERLTTDPIALEKRRQMAQMLKQCAPLAAEISMLEMQLQATEDDLCWSLNHPKQPRSLIEKAICIWKEQGWKACVKKVISFLRKKISFGN